MKFRTPGHSRGNKVTDRQKRSVSSNTVDKKLLPKNVGKIGEKNLSLNFEI